MSEYPLAKLDQARLTLAKLDQARLALAETRTLPEVLKIRDLAEAFKAYVNAAHLGREAQNHAAEIALLASRKAGGLLAQLEKKPGQRTDKPAASVAGGSDYKKTLEETNTPERTAQYWQKLSRIPEETFTQYIEETKTVNNGEISAFGLLKAQSHAEKRKNREPGPHPITFPEPKLKSFDDHIAAITELFLKFSELNGLAKSVQRESLSLQEREQVKTLIQTLRKISKDAGERADALEAALMNEAAA